MTLPIPVIVAAVIVICHPPSRPVREHAGGSPANVAITLARLGQSAQLFSWIGADAHGDILTELLSDSGVVLVPGSQYAPRTSTALARLDATGAAQYEFRSEEHT